MTKNQLFTKDKGKKQLIRFVIFLGVMAWSVVAFKLVLDAQNIPIELPDWTTIFSFACSMMLAASLYTYVVHWHLRRIMVPCLVKMFWGILYMIPIVNLFLSKEAIEDIKEDWKRIGEPEYYWELDLSGLLPFVRKVEDVNAAADNFISFLLQIPLMIVLRMIHGVLLLICSLVLAILIPVISPLITLLGMGIYSVVPDNGMVLVPVIGMISLALVVYQYVVVPVICFRRRN